MSATESLGRRSFLVVLAASIAAAALWLLGRRRWARKTPSPAARRAALRAAARLSDPAGARRIGAVYLDATADERDQARLLDLVFPELAGTGDPASEDALMEGCLARVRRDFEAGRLARVDGWLLSKTEARLYALASFGASPRPQ